MRSRRPLGIWQQPEVSVWWRKCALPGGVLILASFAVIASGFESLAQETKATAPARVVKDADVISDGVLTKYERMPLPTAGDLLRSKPFDWIVLKTDEVLVVEPVAPRPDTLVKLNNDYERYLKGRAGMVDGENRMKDKRLTFKRIVVSLLNSEGEEPDYQLETKIIQRIEYFEDFLLRRANQLIDEGNLPLAYDLLLQVDRRHRENNVRMKEAYDAKKKEEEAARTEEDRFRFNVPDPQPLQLLKTWPHFEETYQKFVWTDADQHLAQGELETAFRLLVTLWEHNADYPGLPEALGNTIDRLLTKLVAEVDYRQARHFLFRLAALDAQHPMVLKWKTELANQTRAMMDQARAATGQGHPDEGARLIELAARIWPDTPGLKEAHRELVDRFQSLRIGVLHLPEPSLKERSDLPDDSDYAALVQELLYEPARVEERAVRYRSSVIESWEPRDLGRQVRFDLRLRRDDWEARPIVTSADILEELSQRIAPGNARYDERIAGFVDQLAVQSPSQLTVHFRRLPLRMEAFLNFTVGLTAESRAFNPGMADGAMATAGRRRFYEHERDERHISLRRVRSQPDSTKIRRLDEIVLVRHDTWDRALQALLRGEIMGISRVGLSDLQNLQLDSRFLVIPFALPSSHFLQFNPRTVALRDGQLRRALSLALPREQFIQQVILEGVTQPVARIASSPIAAASYGHDRLLQNPLYDPQRAAVLALSARKQHEGQLPVLRLRCPPDPLTRRLAQQMIEAWRRVGIVVELIADTTEPDAAGSWDLIYRTTRIIEPLIELWPILAMQPEATVASLKPLPDRMRRQLLDLELANDWAAATKLIHRIENELAIEVRTIPLWEIDEFLIVRRQVQGLPSRLLNAYQDAERWTLQSWYPTETP